MSSSSSRILRSVSCPNLSKAKDDKKKPKLSPEEIKKIKLSFDETEMLKLPLEERKPSLSGTVQPYEIIPVIIQTKTKKTAEYLAQFYEETGGKKRKIKKAPQDNNNIIQVQDEMKPGNKIKTIIMGLFSQSKAGSKEFIGKHLITEKNELYGKNLITARIKASSFNRLLKDNDCVLTYDTNRCTQKSFNKKEYLAEQQKQKSFRR